MQGKATSHGKTFAAAAALLLTATAWTTPATAQKASKSLWWNDPVIIEQVGLEAPQRAKMDAAYASYADKASMARRSHEFQMGFLAALERGDWAGAQGQLDSWKKQDVNPQHQMATMKLEVMQLLSDNQRKTLVESYPRILRRGWRPALRWDRGRGDAKSFQGARKGMEKGGPGKGQSQKKGGSPTE